MRVDKLLNKLCIVKHRNIAKKACANNLIKINNVAVKSSKEVKDMDIIEVNLYGYQTKFRIIKIPTGNVSKASANNYYEVIEKIPL